jgi:hypothetical protein
MSRLAAFLTLIAALTGTPLRQAEAASDLSRTLAELFQADRVEATDGGVGDDSGVTIHDGLQASFTVDLPLSADLLLLPPPLGTTPLSPDETESLRDRVWWSHGPSNCRHAWLQMFLF